MDKHTNPKEHLRRENEAFRAATSFGLGKHPRILNAVLAQIRATGCTAEKAIEPAIKALVKSNVEDKAKMNLVQGFTTTLLGTHAQELKAFAATKNLSHLTSVLDQSN